MRKPRTKQGMNRSSPQIKIDFISLVLITISLVNYNTSMQSALNPLQVDVKRLIMCILEIIPTWQQVLSQYSTSFLGKKREHLSHSKQYMSLSQGN